MTSPSDPRATTEVALVLRTTVPATWAVEAMRRDDDGAIEMTQFSGPRSESRARAYAASEYGIENPEVMAA